MKMKHEKRWLRPFQHTVFRVTWPGHGLPADMPTPLDTLRDEPSAWEARAITRDLARAALSRDSTTGSRWEQNFGGAIETAAAVT